MNSRLDTVQAAILLAKLDRFINWELDEVNRVADTYKECLGKVVKTPLVLENFTSSWAQYTIRVNDKNERNMLQEELKKRQIFSMIYYVKPLHEQKAFSKVVKQKNGLDISKLLSNTVLSLPMHPYLQNEEVLHISNEIIRILDRR